MIDANRVIGIVVCCRTGMSQAREVLVEMAFGLIENDICQVNGETCRGDGETIGRIMNMPSLRSPVFEQCLRETIMDVADVETNAPKYVIVVSDGLNDNLRFILQQLYRQCEAKRSDITFFVVDGGREFILPQGELTDPIDVKTRIVELINEDRVSI